MRNTADIPEIVGPALLPSERLDVREVPPSAIIPHPRNLRGDVVRDDGFLELVGSVKSLGILEPLVAVLTPAGELQLVAGHRRQLAAIEAGLQSVPVMVRKLTDAQIVESMLSENQLRENLKPEQEGAGYKFLIESGAYTVDQLCARIGISRSRIYSALQFTEDGPELLEAVATGLFPPSVANLIRAACKHTGTRPTVFLDCLKAEHPGEELTANQVRSFCRTYKARHDQRIEEQEALRVAEDKRRMQVIHKEDEDGEALREENEKKKARALARFNALTKAAKWDLVLAAAQHTCRADKAEASILERFLGIQWWTSNGSVFCDLFDTSVAAAPKAKKGKGSK